MNRQFDDAIITTDVGQHHDVGDAVCGDYRKEAARHVRRTGDDGIWIPGCDRSDR